MLKNKLKLLETESFELLLSYIQSELNNKKPRPKCQNKDSECPDTSCRENNSPFNF